MSATLHGTAHPDRLVPFVPQPRTPGCATAGSARRPARTASREAQLLLVGDGLAGVAALSVRPSGTPLAGVVVLLAVLALADSDLYRRRLRLSVMDDLAQLWFRGLAAPTAVGAALLLWERVEEGTALLTEGVTFVVLALAARGILYRALARQRTAGRRADNALVLGLGEQGRELVGALRRNPGCGVSPAGYVSDRTAGALDGLPVLALDRDLPGLGLPAIAEQIRADVVFVAPSHLANADVVTALRALGRSGCDVFVLPDLSDLGMWRGHTEEVGGLPLIRLRRSAHRSLAWRAKRPIDLLLAAAGLLVCLPVIGLCALAARVDGGPGVVFRQQRIGLDGKPFTIYKIRSLRPADQSEAATRWNVQADPRLSTLGRVLRRTSLDELPQLWNVVRGDMSLVGPRPERPHFVAKFQAQHPHYASRTRVPVGLTGWAQVNGLRGDTSISDRARYDNQYIENWSLWLDIKIMAWTFAQVLRRAGG